jgi:transposase
MTEAKLKRRFSGQAKLEILMEHYRNKKTVPEICGQHSIAPSQFYTWQEQLASSGGAALEDKRMQKEMKVQRDREADLERQLAAKTDLIFELMEEHVKLKKKLGLS